MKILEVPIFNDDGSIQFTGQVTAAEAQTLLAFAINFTASVGLGAHKKYEDDQRDLFEEEDTPGEGDTIN